MVDILFTPWSKPKTLFILAASRPKTFLSFCLIMDEDQRTKESRNAVIPVDNFIAIAILMAVLIRKTKLATTIKTLFIYLFIQIFALIMKDKI